MKKIILGIETSCDDTCIGIIEVEKINEKNMVKILANEIINQNNLHEKYGGIVPEVAARSHLSNLPILLEKTMKNINLTIRDIHLIAYTGSPGLLSSLLIGINFSRGLGLAHNIETIEVNHLKAHLLVNYINKEFSFSSLGLIISGGHTELWRIHSISNMEKLISTSDDAIGEFFDKVGRIMNLPFPAGPYIEKYGENALPLEISIPKSLSFSGLKTKFTNLYENGVSREIICKTMEVTSANLLIHHIKKYIKNDEKLIVGGGVSANEYIRNVLKTHFNVDFIEKKLCTDNGVMIAFTGYLEKI